MVVHGDDNDDGDCDGDDDNEQWLFASDNRKIVSHRTCSSFDGLLYD